MTSHARAIAQLEHMVQQAIALHEATLQTYSGASRDTQPLLCVRIQVAYEVEQVLYLLAVCAQQLSHNKLPLRIQLCVECTGQVEPVSNTADIISQCQVYYGKATAHDVGFDPLFLAQWERVWKLAIPGVHRLHTACGVLLDLHWLFAAPTLQPTEPLCLKALDAIEKVPALTYEWVWPTPYIATPSTTHITIVGAGIAGLFCAIGCILRGQAVTLIDRHHSLQEGSGNPTALLVPRPTPFRKAAGSLHLQGCLHSQRLLERIAPKALDITGALWLLVGAAANDAEKMREYAATWFSYLSKQAATAVAGVAIEHEALWLKQAGLIFPHLLFKAIVEHPLVQFKALTLSHYTQQSDGLWAVTAHNAQQETSTWLTRHLVLCTALATSQWLPQITPLTPIRGQVTWLNKTDICANPLAALQLPLCYSGYIAPTVEQNTAQCIMGATFKRQNHSTALSAAEHVENIAQLNQVLTHPITLLPDTTVHGRAAIRAQTSDYLPLAGAITTHSCLYVLAGLGSKGFAFASMCSEHVLSQLFQEHSPLLPHVQHALSPQRRLGKRG